MTGRRTLARDISVTGTALHAGTSVTMTLSPSASGAGIVFCRSDKANSEIPARYDVVAETNFGTVIEKDGVKVGVIEHLMAAIAGAEIDDLLVTLDGPEPPILDGDALSYFRLIEKTGTVQQPGARTAIKVMRPVEIAINDASTRLLPSDALEYAYALDYTNTKAIGKQTYATTLTRETFAREIAPARTFGFGHVRG